MWFAVQIQPSGRRIPVSFVECPSPGRAGAATIVLDTVREVPVEYRGLPLYMIAAWAARKGNRSA